MRTDCSNIYILSFTAGADAGLAAVTAYSERDALQILKNSGRYNSMPNQYVLSDIINLGLSTTIRTELLIESYVNAFGAYEAIRKYCRMYKGDKGDPGDVTVLGAVQSDWLQNDNTQLDYIKNKPNLSVYPKYVYCEDMTAYEAITTHASDTLYLLPIQPEDA